MATVVYELLDDHTWRSAVQPPPPPPSPLSVDFTFSPTAPAVGAPVAFQATPIGGAAPIAIAWAFGDASVGIGNPISHSFMAAGDFTIVVTATDAAGQTATASKRVTVIAPPPPPPPVAVPTSLTMTTSKNPSAAEETVTVSGRLLDDKGAGIPGQTVLLEWSWDKITWSPESQTQGKFAPTDAAGNFAATMKFHATSPHSEYIRPRFAATGPYLASTGPVVTQQIVLAPPPPPPPPGTMAALTLTSSPNPSQLGQPVTVSGRLTDAASGLGLGGRTVFLEWSLDQAVWQPDTQIGQFTTDPNGGYTGTMVFNGTADFTVYLRTRFAGGA